MISAGTKASVRPLNICLISEEFPPDTPWGGIATYTHALASGLVRLGHRVHVIVRGWGEDATRTVNGIQVHQVSIPEPSWRWGTWWWSIHFSETREAAWWSWRVSETVRRLAERERIDIVETPEYRAQGLLTRLRSRKIPMIVRLHSPAFLLRRVAGASVGASGLDTWANEASQRMLGRAATVVSAPSRSIAQTVARVWNLPKNSIPVIPNPVDERMFRSGEEVDRDERTILYVGRMERLKGVETLAGAVPIVLRATHAKFRFVGEDREIPEGGTMKERLLKQLAAAAVPREAVAFDGQQPREALGEIYRSAAICVIPSMYESFGYTCVEAMAAGCAVIASHAGALTEIITNEHDGLLVPTNDPQSLANAIVRLLDDKNFRERLGAAARETVRRRFAQDVVCAEMAQMYGRVAARC